MSLVVETDGEPIGELLSTGSGHDLSDVFVIILHQFAPVARTNVGGSGPGYDIGIA